MKTVAAPPGEGAMLDAARIIDADSHVMEPDDIWGRYIDPRFRDRAPRVPGQPRAHVPSQAPGQPERSGGQTFGEILVNGEAIHDRVSGELSVRGALHVLEHYRESVLAGFDAPSHVAQLRRAGFNRTFIYPTIGLWLFAIDTMEAALAGALVRAYNDWLFDYCGHDPAFLNGVGAVNQHDPGEMVAEVRRVKGFGWRAVYLRPNPFKGRTLGHPDYEPFWSECERLDIAVSIHEGTHARLPTAGAERFQTRFGMHACSHPLEQMMALLSLIEGGVLERHPALRVAFLEAGCGWLPYWLFRLDEEHRNLAWEVKKNVRIPPSEYFRRQCFIGCEPGEPYLSRIVDFIGEESLLFGSDYPHIDHTPLALADLFRLQGAADATEADGAPEAEPGSAILSKMLWDNPRRFYGLTPTA